MLLLLYLERYSSSSYLFFCLLRLCLVPMAAIKSRLRCSFLSPVVGSGDSLHPPIWVIATFIATRLIRVIRTQRTPATGARASNITRITGGATFVIPRESRGRSGMIVLSSRTINITESRPGERGRVREVIRITEADTQDITPATTTFSILPTSTIKHQSTVHHFFLRLTR